MAKKSWHNKYISTKWGIAILGFLLLSVALLIPVLEQNQNILSNAMFKKKAKVVKLITCGSQCRELMSNCQNVESPDQVVNRSTSLSQCRTMCGTIYSYCLVHSLCGTSNPNPCTQLESTCRSGCSAKYTPSPPTCSSVGGTCLPRTSCSPDYLSRSAGNEYCDLVHRGVSSCCGPPRVSCSSLEGECVNSNSTYRSCTKYGGRINPAGICSGTQKCCVGAF